MTYEYRTIVIDNGSCICRAGFAGDDQPKYIFPTIAGRPKYRPTFFGDPRTRECYPGDMAFEYKNHS